MKKTIVRIGFFTLAVLFIYLFSAAYPALQKQRPTQQENVVNPSRSEDAGIQAIEMDSDDKIILPEVVWALASGGGTWTSKLRIYDHTGGSVVDAWYYYGGDQVEIVSPLWTSGGISHSIQYTNILSTISSLSGENFYGTSGTLVLYSQDDSHNISADVETVNGNYGKSFPGMKWTDTNAANVGRFMIIKGLTNNSSWRTTVGGWNGAGGGWTMTVQFSIGNANNYLVGSAFTKVISSWDTVAFNPFAEAGVSSGSYDNCYLYVNVITADPSPYDQGLFLFGSKSNNITNDTCSLLAIQR